MSDNPAGNTPTPTHITIGAGGPGGGGGQGNPTPADMPPAVTPPTAAAPQPADPAAPPAAPKTDWTPEEATQVIGDLRKENASWRTKHAELAPKAEAYDKWQDGQKTEVERATERATQLETDLGSRTNELNVLRAAHKHGIPEEDFDLLGSGTPEELDARAARLAARYSASTPTPPAAPPSNRPVEGLRPGASPTPPPPEDHSYPAAWKP